MFHRQEGLRTKNLPGRDAPNTCYRAPAGNPEGSHTLAPLRAARLCPAAVAMIPFELQGGGDGRGDWTVQVPNVLLGTAPDGTFPANATCTNPISPTDPPYDGAAGYTLREHANSGVSGEGFEDLTFHFSTHHRTTTVYYPQASRTETDSAGSSSTVSWSGKLTAVIGPGVS